MLPVAVRVLRIPKFLHGILVYSKTNKYIHICIHVCMYINPQEVILRFSVLAESTKACVFRKHINVFGKNVRTAVKFYGTFQMRLKHT